MLPHVLHMCLLRHAQNTLCFTSTVEMKQEQVFQPHSQAPPLPEREYVNTGRAWYLFSHEHDVIKIRPEFLEQKGNILHVLLINFAFIAQCMDTCSKLPTTFAVFFFLFGVFGYAYTHFSTHETTNMRTNTRLSSLAQLQCLCSKPGKPGNETTSIHHCIPMLQVCL